MPVTELKEKVNIDEKPKQKWPAIKGAEVTVGDLHGNTLKLLFILDKHDVVEIPSNTYQTLKEAYQSRNGYMCFKEHLQKIKVKNAEIFIRLIGDEMADRGMNDGLTLFLLDWLFDNKIKFEILLSNHSMEFIQAYEKIILSQSKPEQERIGNFSAEMLSSWCGHVSSMDGLSKWIRDKVIAIDEVIGLINKVYKPNLKALSYSLSKDKRSIVIYSHAAIDLDVINEMAKKLKILYCNDSAEKLADTIEAINEKFMEHVTNNTVHTLYDKAVMKQGYNRKKIEKTYPFEFTMWNRTYNDNHGLGDPKPFLSRDNKLINGDSLAFCHGHDSYRANVSHVFNLDTQLGKGPRHNEAEYRALYSDNKKSLLDGKTLACTKDWDLAKLDAVIEEYGVYAQDNDGNTLAHLAAKAGRVDIVKRLLQAAQGDPFLTVRNSDGFIVCELAKEDDCFKKLVVLTQAVKWTKTQSTIWHYAASSGRTEVLEECSENICKINALFEKDEHFKFPLLLAKDARTFRCLLDLAEKKFSKGKLGKKIQKSCLLSRLAKLGRPDCIEILREKGYGKSSLFDCLLHGKIPLFLANDEKTKRAILAYGVNQQDKFGYGYAYKAAMKGRVDIIELMRTCPDVNFNLIDEWDYETALFSAKDKNTVISLVIAGASLAEKNKNGQTARDILVVRGIVTSDELAEIENEAARKKAALLIDTTALKNGCGLFEPPVTTTAAVLNERMHNTECS